MIDDSFSDVERAAIIEGFDSWVRGVSARNLSVRIGRQANLDSSSAPSGWVYVLRRATSKEVSSACGSSNPNWVGCWFPSERHIYLAASLSTGDLQAVAAHELGHAMGLEHCVPSLRPNCKTPSVMGEDTGQMCREPTADDLGEFCRLNGCEAHP